MTGARDRPAPAGQEKTSDLSYMLPRHPAEIDRLDVQHYALQEALLGNHLAPIERPARVLDVGSGTGQWAYDVCAELPDALVVGLDVDRSKPGAPPNYGFVRANLLHGLPFVDGAFDFVHQRLMVTSSIPTASWPMALADLVRVTRRGGWVELVEVEPGVHPAGPATERLFELTRTVGRSFGLVMDAAVIHSLGDHLRRAGLARVEQRTVDLPVGEWGGRVGSLTATNLRSLHTRLSAAFESELGVSASEFGELLRRMQEEWEQYRSSGTFVLAFGQRPLD
jgi:ubiquinone/menaquinone biosynthesis C-methylase UbiE